MVLKKVDLKKNSKDIQDYNHGFLWPLFADFQNLVFKDHKTCGKIEDKIKNKEFY